MAMKKKFIDVESPITNEVIEILGTPEELHKKTIKLDLSRRMRGKGIELVLEVENKDGKLMAYPKRIELVKASIRRMMRKRINYVEDSFEVSFKDITARIKPFLLTRKKVSRAVRNNLRKTTKEFLINYAKEKTYLEATSEVLAMTLQKEMLPKLKKIYPLSLCEIRVLETKNLDKADKEVVKTITPVKVEEIEVEQPEEVNEEQTEEVEDETPKKKSKKKTSEEEDDE
jgi:ribosomal protein S3AE